MKPKQKFIDEADLMQQWRKWCASAPKVEDRTVSEILAMQILTIAHHLLTHNRFNRYPQYAKDEMQQEAYLKCHRNLKNYNPDKGTLFSYFTRCCWTAFVTYLAKYYKEMNESRQLLMDALSDLEANPDIHSSIYMEELKRRLRELDFSTDSDLDSDQSST